jgi:hypothetical protein
VRRSTVGGTTTGRKKRALSYLGRRREAIATQALAAIIFRNNDLRKWSRLQLFAHSGITSELRAAQHHAQGRVTARWNSELGNQRGHSGESATASAIRIITRTCCAIPS